MGDGDLFDVIGSRAEEIGSVPSSMYSSEGECGGVVAAGEMTHARRGACPRPWLVRTNFIWGESEMSSGTSSRWVMAKLHASFIFSLFIREKVRVLRHQWMCMRLRAVVGVV